MRFLLWNRNMVRLSTSRRSTKGKRKSPAFYRKKCVAIAKERAKQRDNYTCVRCGRSKNNGNQMHGSHIYPEGTYIGMSADWDNIITLCYLCHFQWWHKHPVEAGIWFKEKYPELYETLKKKSQIITVIDWKKRYEEIISRFQLESRI